MIRKIGIGLIVFSILLFIIGLCIGNNDDNKYIGNLNPNSISDVLNKNDFNIERNFDRTYLWTCKNEDISNNVTRIQLYSEDSAYKLMAMRIESCTGCGSMENNDTVKNYFIWVALFVSDDAERWVIKNFNRKERIEKRYKDGTILILNTCGNLSKRLDIFKISDNIQKSPISEDGLYGFEE